MSVFGLRHRRFTAAVVALSAAALTVAVATGPAVEAKPKPKPPASDKFVPVQLLSFNDYHGHIEPDAARDSRGAVLADGNVKDETGADIPAGGAAYLSTHLNQLRAGQANSLTVAAGDLIGGSTFTSGFFHDEPSVETLDAMNLDVSGVGNHEFDEGVTELLRMQNGGCHPVDGCFKQDGDGNDVVYPGADYQYLAANVVNTQTGQTVLPATSIKQVGSTRIGFIGMTLEGTDSLVAPSGVAGYDFQDEVEAGNRAARALKAQGVKAIVVLLHEGGMQTGTYNGCTGISGPIVDIAENLDPQIDAVITGHTHAAYNCQIADPDGVPRKVVSAMSFGRIITEMKFTINATSGDVMRNTVTATNHIVTRDVAKDAGVESIVQEWVAKADVEGNVEVGTVQEDIKRAFLPPPSTSDNRAVESSLSNLIADAQLDSTQENGAQIAFMNAGGVRSDLVYASSSRNEGDGVVTYREAFNVQPFSNILQTFTMTGSQIEAVLEQQWVTGRPGGRDVLRLGISDGFTYEWSESAPFGSKIDPASIKLNGVTLAPAGEYRVTTSNFLADGGDSYPAFVNGTPRIGGQVDLDALIDFLGANPDVAAPPVARSTPVS